MQLLKKNYAPQLDEKADKYIDFAVDCADRMSSFMKDLLAYSNTGIEEILKKKVNIQELLNEIAALQKSVLNKKYAVILYENLPTVVAHKTSQALIL